MADTEVVGPVDDGEVPSTVEAIVCPPYPKAQRSAGKNSGEAFSYAIVAPAECPPSATRPRSSAPANGPLPAFATANASNSGATALADGRVP